MERKDENVMCVSGLYPEGSEIAAGFIGARERMKRRREITGANQVREMREAASLNAGDTAAAHDFNAHREKTKLTDKEREKQINDMKKAACRGL